jgi:hypothetical protein
MISGKIGRIIWTRKMIAPLYTPRQDLRFQHIGTRVSMRFGVYWREDDWYKSMGETLGGWGLTGFTWSSAKFQRKNSGEKS